MNALLSIRNIRAFMVAHPPRISPFDYLIPCGRGDTLGGHNTLSATRIITTEQENTMKLPRFTWKRLLAVIGLVILIALAGFVIWASMTNPIMPRAEADLQSDATVNVVTESGFIGFGGYIAFEPQQTVPQAGLVLYPGGRVQAAAYAPIARAIAEAGYISVIVHAPLNLSLFNSGAARGVMNAYPDVGAWVVGGHSLGGVAASRFANGNADDLAGLVLLASVPFPGLSLNERDDLRVVSIYAELDGLLSVADVLESRDDLPAGTRFIEIAGGNHAYFGWYGDQSGDNPATISREQHTAQTVQAILDLLEEIE
ncbi:MAG: alpha/beta hydrolase [Anaerolineaceae bacterium]|nr:MAG: alpha/beta hydrolase [Anaerolineaceae bacterium]